MYVEPVVFVLYPISLSIRKIAVCSVGVDINAKFKVGSTESPLGDFHSLYGFIYFIFADVFIIVIGAAAATVCYQFATNLQIHACFPCAYSVYVILCVLCGT